MNTELFSYSEGASQYVDELADKLEMDSICRMFSKAITVMFDYELVDLEVHSVNKLKDVYRGIVSCRFGSMLYTRSFYDIRLDRIHYLSSKLVAIL